MANYSFITPAELEEFKAQPHQIAQKAQAKIDELSSTIETLRAERDAEVTNHEQLINQIESQRSSLSLELDKLRKDNEVLRKDLETIRSTNDAYAKELPTLRKALTDKEDRHLAITHSVDRLMAEKRHAMSQLERAEKENEELQGEITKLNTQIKDSFLAKSDSQARISELEAINSTNQFQITRLQQEREMLEKFVKTANDQVNDKLEELREVRKTMGARITEVDVKNSQLEETLARVNNEADQLRAKVASLELKVSISTAELQSLSDANAQLKEQHQFELNEKVKMSDKIITERKHTHAKIVSLQGQVDNLQQELKTAETNLESMQAELDRTTSELVRTKRELEKEKVNANNTSSSPFSLPSPTSPSQFSPQSPAPIPTLTLASRLTIDEVLAKNDSASLKRELRQMVSIYDDLCKLLLTERNEHRRLSASFTILVKEVKEKAPIMAQQRKEHERLLSEYNMLVHQANLSRQKSEQLEIQIGINNSEISRLQNHAAILEEQLQTLLQESSDEPRGDGTQYRNIRELIQAVSHWKQRVLELETQQSMNTNTEVETKLRNALAELDDLKANRERQMDIMRDYMSKRDSYKVLSQSLQSDRSKFTSPPEEPSSADVSQNEATIATAAATNELYYELKREFDEYKKEQSKSYALLEQQLDQARAAESDAKVALAKAQSESKYLQERYKSTSEDLQSSTLSYDHLRKKIDDYSSLVISQQKTIDELSNRRSELEATIMTQNATLEATKAELSIRKASEDRFMVECNAITTEKGKLLAQIDNMRAMQASAETLAFGERQKLESKFLTVQQEVTKVKSLAEAERKHLYSTISLHETRLAELQTQLTAAQKELAEAREAYGRAKATEESLAQQLSEAKSAQQHSEAKLTRLLDNTPNPKEATETNRLELELSLAKADATNTANLLQAEKAQANQYKNRYEAAESQLSQLREESEKLQQDIAARVATFDERSKADEERIKELEAQLQNINAKSSQDKEASEKQSTDAKAALAARDELQARIQVLENHETSLLSEIQTLKKEVDNAQRNYQHELVAHAGNIQRLESIEKELTTAKAQLADLKAKSIAEKQGYDTREESWRDTQQHLLQQVKELEERLASLKSENESLHNVAESMTALSNKLQQQYMDPLLLATADAQDETSAPLSTPAFAEHDKALHDMREVVRYLRQENSMLDLKCETLVQEKIMYRQEIEELKRAKTSALEQVQSERDRSRAAVRSEEDHKQLMEQVQQLNLLRESNMLLRDDANRANAQLQEAKATIQSLNDQLGPALEEKRANIAKIETLEAELATRNSEIKHHRVRIQKLLDKYQSIEPEEHHKLKEDFDIASKQIVEFKALIEKLEATVAQLTEQNAKLQAQNKLGMQSSKDLVAMTQSLEEKEKALATAQETLQTTTAKLTETERQLKGVKKLHTDKKKTWEATQEELNTQAQALKTENETLKSEVSTLKSEIATIKGDLETRTKDNQMLEFRMKALEKRVASAPAPAPTPAAPPTPTPKPAPTSAKPAPTPASTPKPAAATPKPAPTPAPTPALTPALTPAQPATPIPSIFGSPAPVTSPFGIGATAAFGNTVAPTTPVPKPTTKLGAKSAARNRNPASPPPSTTPLTPIPTTFTVPSAISTTGSVFGAPSVPAPTEPEKPAIQTPQETAESTPAETIIPTTPPFEPTSEMTEEREEDAEETESTEVTETQQTQADTEGTEEESADTPQNTTSIFATTTTTTIETEQETQDTADEEGEGDEEHETETTEETPENTEENPEDNPENEGDEEMGEQEAEEVEEEGEEEEQETPHPLPVITSATPTPTPTPTPTLTTPTTPPIFSATEESPTVQPRTKRIKVHAPTLSSPAPSAISPPPSPPQTDDSGAEFSLDKKDETTDETEETSATTLEDPTTQFLNRLMAPQTTTTTTTSTSTLPPLAPTPTPATAPTPAPAPAKRTIKLGKTSSQTQQTTPATLPATTPLTPAGRGRGRGKVQLNRNFSLNNNLVPTPPATPPPAGAKEWRATGGQKRPSSAGGQAPPGKRPSLDPPGPGEEK